MAEYGEEPDCDECMPEILPENKDAWSVFGFVSDQHIMAFNGPIAINMTPVFKVMDCLKINNQIDCMGKVKAIHAAFITAIKRG